MRRLLSAPLGRLKAGGPRRRYEHAPSSIRDKGSTVLASSSGAAAGVGIIFLIGIYFLPTIVAHSRKVRHQGSVAVINVFLGWTLIGWAVALAMACRSNY